MFRLLWRKRVLLLFLAILVVLLPQAVSRPPQMMSKTILTNVTVDKEADQYILTATVQGLPSSNETDGKKKTVIRKLYPGYVFIQMRLLDEGRVINRPWYFVKEVAGVINFVSGGETPTPLRQAEIDEIKARIAAATGKEVPRVSFEAGETVKVTDGAFANLSGVIDEIDPARGKLKISVSIFGRFTPVELEYWQVQRITE